MNLMKNPRKFLMILILSYGVIIFMTIQILSWTLYFNFDKSGTQIITDLETRNLYLSMDNIGSVFESARSLCKQIFTDNEISKIMYGVPIESGEANSIIDRVASYTNASPDVKSIYIYSKKLDYYYCTLNSMSDNSSDFFDKDLNKIIQNLEGTDFNPIPRIITRQYTNTDITNIAQVYTFIIYDYGSDRKTADGAVVVNIDVASVTSRLKSLAFENNSSYILLNSNKTIMGSSNKESFLQSASYDKAIDTLFDQGQDAGYFKARIDNNDSIFTYITWDDLNWKFIRIASHRSLFSQLYAMRNYTLLISLVILFIALLAMLPIYRNVSPPIRKLVNKVRHLEEIRRDNYSSFREELLHSLLFESSIIHTIYKHFDEMDIKLDPKKKFLLILIKLDDFKSLCESENANDRNLMLFSIGNIACELAAEHFTCESIQTGSDQIAMIINIDDHDIKGTQFVNSLTKKIQDTLTKVQTEVNTHLKISISCTVSNIVKDCTDLSAEFARIIDLSNYRLIYGHSSIIYASELSESRHRNDFKYPAGKESRVFEQLLLGNPDNAITVYKDMVQDVIPYTYNDLMAFLNTFALSVNTFLLKLDNTKNTEIHFEFYEFNKSLNSMETLDEINVRFESLFKEICDSLTVEREEKNSRLVMQIKDYIEKNYQDSNLSLNVIADIVDKSPVYLGRLYKKLTGKSVQDSINEVRLARSKEFLSQTQYTVQEICSRVGIGNEKYFFIFFKKHTGITPNEFRSKKSQK